jgi:hypothetical protein
MKITSFFKAAIFAAAFSFNPNLNAQIAWTGGDGDFFDPAHWVGGIAPGPADIAQIDDGSTATIAATSGTHSIGAIALGDVQGGTESGHVVMNGGVLKINDQGGNPKGVIGLSGTLSTFIMNGGEIFFDGPDNPDNAGSTSAHGNDELDWEVGEKGMGRFEMHNNALMHIGDDLKVAENALGNGSVLIDGTAHATIGSGISVSSGGDVEQSLTIAGNATVDAGNSMGAGSPLGHTDEGYLTMAIGNGHARLTIQDNGVLNIRRLSARDGVSIITVKNHGQFNIFDVLHGKGNSVNPPDRPAEMGPGGDNNNSTYASTAPDDATLILQDDAQMTVNSAPPGGRVQGLGISAPRADADPGGKALLSVRDRASFRVEQNLELGTGRSPDSSDGTIEIIGPDAKVSIGGNLNMASDNDGVPAALDPDGNPVAGKSTIREVITSALQATINITGIAHITNGTLKVKLQGYKPVKGDSFTLVKAGSFDGAFASTDLSEATLDQGLAWQLRYNARSIVLTVTGQAGAPEDNGATPKTDTKYLNVPTSPEIIYNERAESMGVSIARNGNVIIGWEDDGDGIKDQEATWSLYDGNLNRISPTVDITSLATGETLTTAFLSYFRKDGSPTPPNTSWGPKIKASLFADGIGMGGTSYDLDKEVPEFAPIQLNAAGDNAGDFPSVQLLNNDGTPVGIVAGVTDEYAERDGDIRIADWDFLSNGNILIVGESRQGQDLVDLYGGTDPANHAIYRIVTKAGVEVKTNNIVSSSPIKSEIWHGAGVTKDGFGIRFDAGGGTVRLFKNDGTPLGDNINLATLTGEPGTGAGGRGDSAGFHGNGKDAYVVATAAGDQAWVTVLNADGTLRWYRSVADDIVLQSAGRADAAIDPSGRVVVVFDAKVLPDGTTPVTLVFGRMFDQTGKPLGGTFHVSETEVPDINTQEASSPRVSWRGGLVAVVWESKNSPDDLGQPHAAARFFSTFSASSAEGAGLTRIVPDTPVNIPSTDSLDNWEPYSSVLGNNYFLIEGNTFAEGSEENQRFVVMVQPVTGGPGKLTEAFYADNGTPFKGQINLSRQNGNPGRVAGDKRPGAVDYITGGEASPHAIPEFQSDNRWTLGFDRGDDGRYATIETFKLDPATLTPTPLSKAQDSANGRLTAGAPTGDNQISRFGGELAGLDNGNFVSVVEDRSGIWNTSAPGAHAVVATIFAPNGSIVKDTWKVADGDIWSNAAAYKGGFAVRASGIIYFYANDGTLTGQVDQKPPAGGDFDRGRGDGTRIASHINTPYVFLAGVISQLPTLAVYDSRDASFVTVSTVSELGFGGAWDRIGLAVDALNRVVVGGVVQPTGFQNQQVAARVVAFDPASKTVTPLTPSFFAFINVSPGDIRTLQVNPSITTKQILIAAKGEINLQNKPEQGPNSPRQVNFYTVLSHPDPKDDPTAAVGGSNGPKLSISRTAGNVTITWDLDGFTLQKASVITGPWSPVTTTGKTFTTAATGTAFYRLNKP